MEKNSKIYEVFEDFDTNVLSIADFGIVMNGCLITHIFLNENDKVEVWAGDPNENEYAEQVILAKSQLEELFNEVYEKI